MLKPFVKAKFALQGLPVHTEHVHECPDPHWLEKFRDGAVGLFQYPVHNLGSQITFQLIRERRWVRRAQPPPFRCLPRSTIPHLIVNLLDWDLVPVTPTWKAAKCGLLAGYCRGGRMGCEEAADSLSQNFCRPFLPLSSEAREVSASCRAQAMEVRAGLWEVILTLFCWIKGEINSHLL